MQGISAGSGLGIGSDWRIAISSACAQALAPLADESPDLVVAFISAAYQEEYTEVLQQLAQTTKASHVAGCSASAVIANDRELEDQPGVALLALRLPPGAIVDV